MLQAVHQLSPWLTCKLTPLYKGKGDAAAPDNYRALAVGHPVAKAAAAVLNQRLETVATTKGLRAST